MITIKRAPLSIAFISILAFNSISQRPDFAQLKKDILEAQSQKEKAQAMMVYGGALSPRDANKIFDYADSVLLLDKGSDTEFYQNASIYLKAVGHYKKGELTEAKKLFKEAYNYFEYLDGETRFKTLNFLGITHLRMNHADSAIIIYEKILNIIDSTNINGRISANGNIARAYRRLGRYAESMDHFEKTVELDPNNQFSILNSYLNIAGMYFDMELYDKGISVLKKVNIKEYQPQPVVIAYYSNLGQFYFRKNEYDSALKYLEVGLDMAEKMRQPQQAMGNRLTQAQIYLDKDKPEKTKELLKKAKEGLKIYGPFQAIMNYNSKLANYFINVDQLDSAIFMAKQSIKLAAENKTPKQIGDSYKILATAFEKKDLSDSSTYYLKLHDKSRNDQLNAGKEQFAQDAKARYMLAEKEKEVEQEKKESMKLKQWQKWSLLLLAILVLTALYIYFRLKKSKSAAIEKSIENVKLEKQIKKERTPLVELKSKAILPVDEIVSIKADGHYLEFKMISKSNPEVDRNQLKSVLESLPSKFVQIHRSYVINVEHIKIKQSTKVILNDGTELPVSRTYKEQLKKALN